MTPLGISTQIKYAICYQVWHQTCTTSRTKLARPGKKFGATSCAKSGNGSGGRSGARSDAKSDSSRTRSRISNLVPDLSERSCPRSCTRSGRRSGTRPTIRSRISSGTRKGKDLVPNQLLEEMPDLVPCLVHTRYQMLFGAIAASGQTASKAAGGMGEALRFVFRNHSLNLTLVELIQKVFQAAWWVGS